MADVRYDDIDGIRALCGEPFGDFGPTRRITQEMVDRFADLTGDHQWIHVDVERSQRESPFGATIVHGFFVLSMLAGLERGCPHRVTDASLVVNYGADKLRFVTPVKVGSEIHIRTRLADVTKKDKGTMVTWESEIGIVGEPRPAVVYRHLSLYVAKA